jgi:hypothetical protein
MVWLMPQEVPICSLYGLLSGEAALLCKEGGLQ